MKEFCVTWNGKSADRQRTSTGCNSKLILPESLRKAKSKSMISYQLPSKLIHVAKNLSTHHQSFTCDM